MTPSLNNHSTLKGSSGAVARDRAICFDLFYPRCSSFIPGKLLIRSAGAWSRDLQPMYVQLPGKNWPGMDGDERG
jgi:hypothetical protein